MDKLEKALELANELKLSEILGKKKEDEEAEKIRFNEVRKLELYVYNTAKQIFKRDQKFCDRILKALDFDPDKIQPVFDKLTKLEKDYKGQDLAKLFRYVLREDFGIS